MAAALAALEVLVSEPGRVAKLRENVALFVAELARYGISVRGKTAIVPIVVGDEKKALAASAALEEVGFLVPAIRYPTVARGSARLRVALMSAHTPEQLRSAAAAIAANCVQFGGENLV
jgi:6-carboxyhexanoate--CoA ligase